jgi:hypothetical protein
MVRDRYDEKDFDFAMLYVADRHVCYVLPVDVFASYASGISLVEASKRQQQPRSAMYRERWDLLSCWATHAGNGWVTPVKFGEALTGNTEPSLRDFGSRYKIVQEGVETRRRASSLQLIQ